MISAEELQQRFIPFASLRYSTEAFIDYCLDECKPKYNYALIGPGVSQNPNQPVSLREHHGFQVGGVSIPHGKVNTPHLHFTCEVFICMRGRWRLQWGFNPEVQEAEFGVGDIVSVPTWLYRGFTNIGADDGFLFTVLGGDHTGGIIWSPQTLASAARAGVLLTDQHRIVDTRRGDSLQPGEKLLQPMSEAEITALRHWSAQAMSQRMVRADDLVWSSQALLDADVPEGGSSRGGAQIGGSQIGSSHMAAVVGLGMAQDRNLQAPVVNAHGMSIEWLRLTPGAGVSRHRLAEKQVLIVQHGDIDVSVQTQQGPRSQRVQGHGQGWDCFSLPPGCWRSLRNEGAGEARALLITAGDHRKHIEWDPLVVQRAALHNRTLDANAYVAFKHLVDRGQR